MYRLRYILLLFLLVHHTVRAQHVTQYVDPRIGSIGLGRVFIGPCHPFGMVKPSPDCGVSHNAGWAPMPTPVSGFSQTHVSGTGGGPKYGNILVRPFSGADQHRSSEEIRLGYYSCTFQESGIHAEVTTARRASFYRFTYPTSLSSLVATLPGAVALTSHHTPQTEVRAVQSTTYTPHIEFDLSHFLGRNPTPKAREAQQFEAAHLDTLSATEWGGYQTISGGWNNGEPYTVYFYAVKQAERPNVLLLKVGISFISVEQARINTQTDIPHWDFDTTYQQCLTEWENLLSRLPIQATASNKVKRMYYTALYHMCLMPTDRQEVGRENDAPYYDDYYAIWDTYRTSTPLLTRLCPERATAIAQSLLTIYQRDGFLPDARSGNSNGRTQGGSNAEIVLCDAIANGLPIDADLALEAMLKDATVVPQDDEAEGRGGLEEYNRLGYIPYIIYTEEGYRRIPRAGNRTVEYSFCDWAIAQVALHLREEAQQNPQGCRHTVHYYDSLYHQYTLQSTRWKNLWRKDYHHDGAQGFILPRDSKGRWLDHLPFGHSHRQPLTFPYTPDVSYEGPWYGKWWDCFMYEASSWEYSFSIPHDIPGLIEACGGAQAFEARLDTFFAHGYYNVANEPSFLTPCLYLYVGRRDKSLARIREIITQHFSDRPDGLPGNDDGGAMSSWLACHLLGQYPLAGTQQWLALEPINDLPDRDTSAELPTQTSRMTGATHLVSYQLHGQTRRFEVAFHTRDDSVRLDWSIVRNLKRWRGSYTMTPQALHNAQRLNYEQPLDGQHLTLSHKETFLLLPRKALRQLQHKGTCRFAHTQWKVINRENGTLHLIDLHEGAEMWVQESDTLPLILRMQNNPIEINWTIETL